MSAAVATQSANSSKLTAGQLPAWISGVVLAISLVLAASLFALLGSFGLIRTLAVALVIYAIIIVAASAVLDSNLRSLVGPQ